MAYFYNSNYPQFPDNYQYYPQYNYNYDSTNHDYSRYVQYYDTEFNGNAYQHAPNPSLVGYYYSNYYQPESLASKNNAYFRENGDNYYDDVVTTQYIVSYNTANGEAKANEVTFEEYNPQPFHGGYDMNQTYGKPLPPSDDICYPLSKKEAVDNPTTVPSLDDKKIVESEAETKQKNEVTPTNVIQEGDEELDDDDDDFDDEYDEDYDDGDEGFDDDGGDGGEEEKGGGEKQDDSSKEPMMIAPVASLGDALDKKEDKKVDEGEKKDDFDGKDSTKEEKSESFKDDAVHEKDKDKNVGEVIKEETPSKFEAEKKVQEQEQEQEKEEEKHLKGEGNIEEMNGSQVIRRQIPPGYGMESLDLCEGLFGGYFPCLWKRKHRIDANSNTQESGYSYENLSDYDYEYCCKDTLDYLFGNPNPYGGSMPEKGSYGDPVYSYQRYYPQQPVTEQLDCYGGTSSLLQSSRYYYGHNGDYYQ